MKATIITLAGLLVFFGILVVLYSWENAELKAKLATYEQDMRTYELGRHELMVWSSDPNTLIIHSPSCKCGGPL